MTKTGPKSKAELEFEENHGVIGGPQRPAAPDDLTEEEKVVWDRVVRAMRADWFGPETYDLLRNLARHVVLADRLAGPIQTAMDTLDLDPLNPDAAKAMKNLTGIQARETQLIVTIARSLRITLQATRTREHSRGTPAEEANEKPIWEDV